MAVISNEFWREHYNADPKVLGRTAKINSKIYTIVGVLTPALDDPALFGGTPAFWLLDPTRINLTLRGGGWYTVAARLKPGVTIEQAQAEMTLLAERMAREHPKTNEGRGLKVVPYPTSIMMGTDAQLTWLVLALSGMVLLIACVNLANLQLVRTMRRTHEIGVRLALGCSRSQLLRLLLTESPILSRGGWCLGFGRGQVEQCLYREFFWFRHAVGPPGGWLHLRCFTGHGCGFRNRPGLDCRSHRCECVAQTSGRGATSIVRVTGCAQALVVIELGLALTLLAGAGFFVTGIYKLTHQELGWHADNVIVGFIELDHDHYGEHGDPRSLAFGEKNGLGVGGIAGRGGRGTFDGLARMGIALGALSN